ncbi:uncharacterized protein LOC117109925 isoform X2 [Anneissia japonica]|uniref:uncharacterized protein LOC117109925 isoform X2 n=1 Tax=Anneissia japonica TaxID=1529436 RepID=UPI0014259944|nr:uncharacterized protein LOC117109925 isoform X2 [Anneissia japonica]
MRGKTPLDFYRMNKCSEYDETTRDKKKEELIDLIEELSIPSEIAARGEDAVKAFTDEIKNGEMTVVNSRFMFLGNEGVGKTSCVNAMLGRGFNQHEPSTDGIVTTVFQTMGENSSKWEEQKGVEVCELTTQMHEHAIAANVAKKITESQINTDVAASSSTLDPRKTTSSVSSASLKDEVTETMAPTTLQKGKNGGQGTLGAGAISMNLPMKDLANRLEKKLPDGIHKKLVKELADQRSELSYFGGQCDITCIWDYAGHLSYYITHRFFITDGSSYGLVFSLLDDMDAKARPRDCLKGQFEMTNLQMNIFWLRSIYEHAVLPRNAARKMINGNICSPPISLIGTHMDLLPGSDEEKQKLAEDKFKRIFDAIKGTPYECHVDRETYAVDNTATSDAMIDKLKRNVGGYMKAMAKTVPTKWVHFQIKVQEIGKTSVRMSIKEITKIAVNCGIAKETVIHVLTYFNDLGIILYSPTNTKLKNSVITNIPILIGIFTKIITAVNPDDVDKVPVMINHWRKLDEEGILAEQLVRHLWRDVLTASGNDNDVIFEEFIEIMKLFGLLFEKKRSEDGTRIFVVPSRMKTKTENLEVKADDGRTVSIYVTPSDFLPDAVYDVLVVKFVDLSQDKCCHEDPKLFQNQAEIGLDDKHYLRLGRICIDNKQSLKLEITRRTEKDQHGINKPTRKPHPIACMEVLHILKQHLSEVYPSKGRVGYALQILCSVCSTPEKPHFQDLESCLQNELMICDKSSDNTAMSTSHVLNSFVADWSYVNETKNFHSIQCLILDLGTGQMRRFFMKESKLEKKSDVGEFMIEKKDDIHLKYVGFGDLDSKVFSPDANIDNFDMTTLILMIRYCFNGSKPESFWECPPDEDNSELSNLVRIYQFKKSVLDCSCNNRVTDEEFDKQWKKLTTMFKDMGVSVEEIEKYRNPWRLIEELKDTDQTYMDEKVNFSTINSLVFDVGTQTMKKFFLSNTKLSESNVGTFLINERKNGCLKSVRIFEDQCNKMFTQKADINTFDITILMMLIRHCCSSYPKDFWVTPDLTFFIKLANLIQIHQYRNSELAHCSSASISNKKFEKDWVTLTDYLLKSGADFKEIEKYKKLHSVFTCRK